MSIAAKPSLIPLPHKDKIHTSQDGMKSTLFLLGTPVMSAYRLGEGLTRLVRHVDFAENHQQLFCDCIHYFMSWATAPDSIGPDGIPLWDPYENENIWFIFCNLTKETAK